MATIDSILPLGGDVSKLALRQYLASREIATAQDYGAVMDGLVDDGPAITAALATAKAVFLKPGTYRIGTTVTVPAGALLLGSGFETVLVADDTSYPVITLVAGDAVVSSLRTKNGRAGIHFHPRDAHTWHNRVENVVVERALYGVYLDGFSASGFRCYWNTLQGVHVWQPLGHGVLLDKSPGGSDDDTPNANHFRDVHVFSNGQSIPGGSGFYIKQGNFMNVFADCEANMHPDAHSCVRVNGQSNAFINLYTESTGVVDNVYLEAGSSDTRLMSVFHVAAGSAVRDFSGGAYDAFRAGYPDLNSFQNARIRDLSVERLRYEVAFIETPGVHLIDASKTYYRVSAFAGEQTIELPHPAEVPGAVVTVKKSESTANRVIVQGHASHGIHPEGFPVSLEEQYDFVTLLSYGGGWAILNRGFPNPIGPWTLGSSAFSRSFNAGGATLNDVAVALNSLILDLKLRRVLR